MHRHPRRFVIPTLLLIAALAGPAALADRRPHAGMLRFPDVSATHIVFSYAGDLWLVPRAGGQATPLASPPGRERFPRFSADGQAVAFIGYYDGNADIYTIPTTGGVPTRVTHHPARELLSDWTPDGRLVFSARNHAGVGQDMQMFTVGAAGGMPEQLPVPYGYFGAISPDGEWLAYTPGTRDFATWKRYRGGMATDIWLFNLRDHSSKKITDWDGTDSQPMWLGRTVYYMSDGGPAHRLNIWSYNTANGQREQITNFTDFDVKWPAIGPGDNGAGEIVFQNGTGLYLLDLESKRSRAIDVIIPGDIPTMRPQRIDVSDQIRGWDLSPTGKRAVFEARGDIWTVPAKQGAPRSLTRTSGVAERDPLWSPDGRWIAYLSDQTGEYELYIMQSDGKGETRRLTRDGTMFRYTTAWSPDSKHILFTDCSAALYVHTIETKKDESDEQPPSGETKLIDVDPWGNSPSASWSHDSTWVAYTRYGDNQQPAIWLYCLPTGEKHQVTSGMFSDTWPTFDREGKYLFFASNRNFKSPIYEDIGSTFVYTNTDVLAFVPLRDDVGWPWTPKIDEEPWEEDEEEADATEDEDKDEESSDDDAEDADAEDSDEEAEDAEQPSEDNAEDAAEDEDESKGEDEGEAEGEEDADEDEDKPLKIDLEGFEQRATRIPVQSGAFYNLAVNAQNQLVYIRGGRSGAGQPPAIKLFDLGDDDREEQTVMSGVGRFRMSSDGNKLLLRQHGTMGIVAASPGQSVNKDMSLDGMEAVVNPREEWRQVFIEAWRIQRDYFYVPNMHGVDWPALREHYIAMLDDCVSRSDVSFVISELIAELSIGHAYYSDDGSSATKSVPVGLLGVDFELHDGAYRIKDVIEGGVWDLDARGPLSRPGVKVKAGDYLLAVDDIPLDTTLDPWAAFEGLEPGRTVTLTVSDQPTLKDKDAEEDQEPGEEGDEEDDKGEEGEEGDEDEEVDEFSGQREVSVRLIGSGRDGALRYRSWVEGNRAYVAEQSDGQVGYIHVPDTSIRGQNELFRQFYGQRHKAALIIDERWNGGGQIPLRFIELLNRPLTNYWANRSGHDEPEPDDAHHGPKCMLINGEAGSGGDAFPYYFRQAGLGKLIGTRTWGGLVGISGNPGLIDGHSVSVPQFGFYELDGTWGIESYGVDPDIEVIDDPALMIDGGDPQLDRAIELMLSEIQRNPYVPVPAPRPPDRSGMGLPGDDK